VNRYVTRCLNCKQSYYVDEEDKHICFPIAPRAAEVGVRSATHAEKLMILRARLSEHLSPAEDRELLAAAAALSSRPAIFEECARVCDGLQQSWKKGDGGDWQGGCLECADAIRTLGGQNAAPQAGQPKSIAPFHEGHAAGPAVAAPYGPGHDLPCWPIDPPAPAEVAEGED
jgi:hypothetical protein